MDLNSRNDSAILASVSRSPIAERFERVCRDRASGVGVRDLSDGTATTFENLLEHYQALQRAFRAAGIASRRASGMRWPQTSHSP